jgi:DNA-binding SARP family transcriptional activator
VLGRVSVELDGREVPRQAWGLRRARLLLLLLALAPQHRLPRDRVLDLLWPGVAPAAALHNAHQAARALRRVLGAAPGTSPVRVGTTIELDCEAVGGL